MRALLLWVGCAWALCATAAERVVTLAPNLAELVCAVGACDTLVGVSAYSDYPAEVRSKLVLGDSASLNLEALIALRPTAVLAWGGGTPVTVIQQMQRLGLPVRVVTTESLEEVATALETLGTQLAHAEEGRLAAQRFRARIDGLRAPHRGLPPLRVLYQIETGPSYTVNGHSPISEVIRLCGGQNVFASLPVLSGPVSDEALLAAAPEVVLHSELRDDRIARFWARFPRSAPMRNHAIFGIDGDLLTRSGPRLAEGAGQVCAALDQVRATRR
jgi:iron complex transport system substrate-binding protein